MALHPDCVDAVDAGQVAVWVLLQKGKVSLTEATQEKHFFCLRHRLDHEPVVMTEEEEASAGSTGLACFEYVASVLSLV